MEKRNIYIAAGGTGGHINAAIGMGEALAEKYHITYLTGTRYLDYQLYKNQNVKHLETKPLRTKNVFKLAVNVLSNVVVFINILFLYLKTKPAFVLGAGGYVCGPTLLAAKILGKPVFIIEQNAVMGLTNKLLSKIADKIFVNFENTKGLSEKFSQKVIYSGNPIRQSIKGNENKLKEELNILVFGGSLGAKQINDSISDLVKKAPKKRLNITHQVGKGNLFEVGEMASNITYEQCEYINDMQKAYEASNIIISRAGASTVSELREVKRPSILIPFPLATDNHQYYNAKCLKETDLFYVGILDHTKERSLLSQDLEKELNKIIEESLFYQKEDSVENAVSIISKEIEKYVWN